MVVFGKERRFLLTVGASAEIAELCPDGDLSRLSEVLSAPYVQSMQSIARIIVALNKGYEQRQKFNGEEYNDPLTVDMVMSLDTDEVRELQREALSAFRRDTKTTIKTESKKKTE